MAGTPTTNYNLPTIADTDPINGVSAINGLATAVDTALKQVADSASTGGAVTAGTGIKVEDGAVSVDTEWLSAQIASALAASKCTTWGDLNERGFIAGAQE